MAKVKRVIQNFSFKQLMLSLTVILCLVLFLVVSICSNRMIARLKDQQAALRWDESGNAAQVSSFFVKDITVDEMQIKNFEHQLEKALKEAAVTKETESSRLFVDAYSSLGEITVVSEQGTLEAQAVGIGGDFFLFHPFTLVDGSYFSGNDLMKDSVILDEEAAWQLFGSNKISGMSVMIGGTPHYISGVIKRDIGRLAEGAGLKETVIYVSHETLSSYGNCEGISTYEVIAPNPVKGFVANTLKEKFGLKETEMIVVENSARYSAEAIILVILDFGIRSMQNAAVRFPFWENIARGYEDIRAVLLLVQGILLMVPVIIILGAVIINRNYIKNGTARLVKEGAVRLVQNRKGRKK